MTSRARALGAAPSSGSSDAEVAPTLRGILATLPGPALLVGVAAVYLLLAQASIWLNDPLQLGAVFWPPAGVSLGLLLLTDRARWPWILAGVALGEATGNILRAYQPAAIALWTAGNTIEPLIGALLIRHFSPAPGALKPLGALLAFLAFGVVVGPLIGGTIGSIGTIVFYELPPWFVWPKYVVGDGLGALVVAPVLLTWSERSVARSRLEAAALAVSVVAVTLVVFRDWDVTWDVTLPYLIVPFLMWAGLRFGLRGIALVALAVTLIANWETATAHGPFVEVGGTDSAVILLQLFLGIVLTSGLMLASLASDLTDSKEAARRDAEHNAEVQRNREFRDAFVGVLSHEIRTPITTIYGMSHLLRKRHDSLESETVAQYLDDIGVESDRLRRLTEDLLVLSRADGGRLVVAAQPIVIGHLVRGTVESERERAPAHVFEVQEGSHLPLVLGEDVYIEQVVRNFLNNAAKYSPAGSRIRVAVTPEAGGAAVRVIDEGPGLPDGSPDRLFDLFYRSSTAIGGAAGAGIGLFVCRQLIQAMGGRVWAAQGNGSSGAEFGFWLPAAGDLEAEERVPAPAVAATAAEAGPMQQA